MKAKVAVLMGGRSAEREISLLSGEQVYQALREKGYTASKIDCDATVAQRLLEERPDVVFIALHGRYGEDGTIQGLLEILGLPYTGSGVMASAVAMNKAMAKRVFQAAGIQTPPYAVVAAREYGAIPERVVQALTGTVGVPAVVKPACEGSTIGMSIVKEHEALAPALELAFSYDEQVVAERFVDGVEITVGVLGNDPQALPTLEIVTATDFYDYETKYTAGLSEHIIPARLSDEQNARAQELAVRAHSAIGCRGFSRVDIIVDKNGEPHVLEINTIPGMTSLSLFPDAARAAGYEFPELIAHMVELALDARR